MFPPESNWKAPDLSQLPSWEGQSHVGLDTEFEDPTLGELGLGARRGVKVAGYSFAFMDGRKYYVPVRHPEGNVDCDQGMAKLRHEAKHFKGRLVGANLPTELDILAYEPTGRITFPSVELFQDVQIAAPLINELHHTYNLEVIAQRLDLPGKDEALLKRACQDYGADISKRSWKAWVPKIPAKYVGPYGEHDAWLPLQILKLQEEEIERLGLQQCWELYSRALPVLLKMRQRGVAIDMDRLDLVERNAKKQEIESLNAIHHLTGHRISPGDTMKLGACVPAFEAIGIQVPQSRDQKTGNLKYSIDKEFLASVNHPVAKHLRDARKAGKLYSTFVDSIRAYQVKGRIHCTLRAIVGAGDNNEESGAAFGRLSCVAKGTLVEVLRDNAAYPKGIPIEDVKPGDYAYSYDDSLKLCLKKVTKAWKTGTRKVLRVHWRGYGGKHTGYVDLTPEHLVRKTSGEFVRADSLLPQDCVMALSRGTTRVKNNHQVVRLEYLEVEVDVYDLTIEDTHNFIAGELCVHNCVDPNLQQQPKDMRAVFVPEPGCLWACMDYSSQEPRWTTHFAAKLKLPGAAIAAHEYCTNVKVDPHALMAKLTGLPRAYAKALFLGLCYGEGGAKLCGQLGLPTRWAVRYRESGSVEYFDSKPRAAKAHRESGVEGSYYEVAGLEGQKILDTFHQRVPFVGQLAKRAEKKAKACGEISIFGGRVLHFPQGDNGSYDYCYKALNRLIQGSAGLQMLSAMVEADRLYPDAFISLQVHDELDGSFECIEDAKKIARVMRDVAGQTHVPFRIDVEVGKSWGDLHQVCGNDSCTNLLDNDFGVWNNFVNQNPDRETYYCPGHNTLREDYARMIA